MPSNLLKASSSFRRLGLSGSVGFVVYVLTSSRDDFKGIPTWGIALVYVLGAFVVWCYLWAARWYRRKAEALSGGTKNEDPQ